MTWLTIGCDLPERRATGDDSLSLEKVTCTFSLTIGQESFSVSGLRYLHGMGSVSVAHGPSANPHVPGASGNCTHNLGCTELYLGPIAVLRGRNGGSEPEMQPGLSPTRAKEAETWATSLRVIYWRQRPDSAPCSPPLKHATSRSRHRQIEASGAI